MKFIIKPIITLQTALLLCLTGCSKIKSINKTENSTQRKLIWSDEFNGKKIDEKKWNIRHEHRRTDPEGKAAWWHKDNAYLEKGNLVIRTSQLTDGAYAGACIETKGKFERAFGYYETRVKMQKEQGHWGAFWLFNNSVNNVGDEGRDGTEIDVFESPYIGLGQDKVQSALHYDGYDSAHKAHHVSITDMNLNDGNWHTFAVEWTPDKYRFYYDGKLVWETSFGGVCQVPLYLKFSDEIGVWGGILDIRKAKLPDYMLVDYVRVYK